MRIIDILLAANQHDCITDQELECIIEVIQNPKLRYLKDKTTSLTTNVVYNERDPGHSKIEGSECCVSGMIYYMIHWSAAKDYITRKRGISIDFATIYDNVNSFVINHIKRLHDDYT